MRRVILTFLCCLLAGPLFALTGAPAAAQPTPDAALRADYQFQETLDSWAGTARPLTNLGLDNAFVQEEIDGGPRTVLAFPEGGGLQLALVAGVIPAETYSIVVFFRFDSVDGYRRIIDVKNRTSDTGLYVLNGAGHGRGISWQTRDLTSSTNHSPRHRAWQRRGYYDSVSINKSSLGNSDRHLCYSLLSNAMERHSSLRGCRTLMRL